MIGKHKHEITRKPPGISGNSFIEALRRNTLESGQVRIKEHSLATNDVNLLTNRFLNRLFRVPCHLAILRECGDRFSLHFHPVRPGKRLVLRPGRSTPHPLPAARGAGFLQEAHGQCHPRRARTLGRHLGQRVTLSRAISPS